jgi:sugar O-acyltransferase (sialic acid O-acetyltransferase NeuD family)
VKGLLLLGGGGHCRSCIDVIETEKSFVIRGVIDWQAPSARDLLCYPYLGSDDELDALLRHGRDALVTVGQIKSAAVRVRLYTLLKTTGATLPVIISPHAYVSAHGGVGEGTVVFHGAIVNACADIGRNCIINSRALVEHDATIGDHCHVSTGAIVNGGCSVGDETFIGSGAVVYNGVTIGSGCVIAGGAAVSRDLPDGTVYRG